MRSNEDREPLKIARPIEHEWLDWAEHQQEDNEFCEGAWPGEHRARPERVAAHFVRQFLFLVPIFVGFKAFCS